jgi:hypothetical protein
MKFPAFVLAAVLILLIAANSTQALYFTIHLKNGNEITTEKYWEDGDRIRYFTEAGSVALPRNMIKSISRHDGELGSDRAYFSTDFLNGATEEDEIEAVSTRVTSAEEDQKQEIIEDIKDRIMIIETNLTNLERNRQTYLRQQEKYQEDAKRAQERIEAFERDRLTSREYTTEYIDIEQSKKQDADAHIERVSEQINNTSQMFEKQQRMKERLESELARLTGE